MDLGYSGWGLHRYEVWFKSRDLGLTYWPESPIRKATRQAALRMALNAALPKGTSIELVNLATGKHEVVRESVVEPEVDFEAVKANVLSYIDRVAPGKLLRGGSYRKGYEDCRKVVEKSFVRRLWQP